MTGYLKTYNGEKYRLPTIHKWNIKYTFSVPCDAFEAEFNYSAEMLDVLKSAIRFEAFENGKRVFFGVVDGYEVVSDLNGKRAVVSGRSMAALLIDNEAAAVEYSYPTADKLVKDFVAPFNISCAKIDNIRTQTTYSVDGGSSCWSAVRGFAKRFGGFEPYFTIDGEFVMAKNVSKETAFVVTAKTPVLSASFYDSRYGIISEMVIVNKSDGTKQSVKNSDFIASGGSCRHVLYMPKSVNAAARRYTGQYQIDESKKDRRRLVLTLPGVFLAFPFDIVSVNVSEIGVTGKFRVDEAECSFDSSGETTILTMSEVQ